MFIVGRRGRANQRSVTVLERTAQSESLFSGERHVMHASRNAQHFVIYQEWGAITTSLCFFSPLEHTVQMSELEIPDPLHNTQSVILSLKNFNPDLPFFLPHPPPQKRKKKSNTTEGYITSRRRSALRL